MIEDILRYIANWPKELVTVLLAMIPVGELRISIPWALAPLPWGGGLSWSTAFVYSIIGNFVPVIPVLLLLEPVSNWLRKWKLMDRFFTWLFERTRKRGKAIEKYEAIGLAIFVGIPLPGTGAWTGALAAFLFGIPFRLAVPSILLGILIAGVVVTLAALGLIGFLGIVSHGA